MSQVTILSILVHADLAWRLKLRLSWHFEKECIFLQLRMVRRHMLDYIHIAHFHITYIITAKKPNGKL